MDKLPQIFFPLYSSCRVTDIFVDDNNKITIAVRVSEYTQKYDYSEVKMLELDGHTKVWCVISNDDNKIMYSDDFEIIYANKEVCQAFLFMQVIIHHYNKITKKARYTEFNGCSYMQFNKKICLVYIGRRLERLDIYKSLVDC
jgi:hypothetical protein